VPIFP